MPDCAAPVDPAAISALAERADDAIDGDDPAAFAVAWDEARTAVLCLRAPLPTGPWARLLYGAAVVDHATGQPWEREVDAALRTDPGVARSFGPPEARTRAVPPPLKEGPPVADGRFWVDGHPVTHEAVLDGDHVVQRALEGTWDNRFVSADVWPEAWRGTEPRRRRPALLVAGLAAGVAGAAVGAGSYVAAHGLESPTDAQDVTWTVVNTAGWTTAAAGAGLVLGWGLRW